MSSFATVDLPTVYFVYSTNKPGSGNKRRRAFIADDSDDDQGSDKEEVDFEVASYTANSDEEQEVCNSFSLFAPRFTVFDFVDIAKLSLVSYHVEPVEKIYI